MTFQGNFFFPSEVPEFLSVLNALHSALLRTLCTLQYFVFVFLRNKVQTSQKNTGEWFTT